MKIPTIKLSDGNKIPVLGHGTWQLTGSKCIEATRTALELGYNHIDTAQFYGNQKEIGKAIFGAERESLFITSKLWLTEVSERAVPKACEKMLRELGTSYLDLLLIHWPNPLGGFGKTLKAMQALKETGKIKSIGISNFTIKQIEESLKSGVEIVTNQVEFHPGLYQKELLKYCKEKGITITAYSPIARGNILQDSLLEEIASKYNKTVAQVCLRWLVQKETIVIPKASSREHLLENMKIFDWKLERKDEEKIDAMGNSNRLIKPFFAKF